MIHGIRNWGWTSSCHREMTMTTESLAHVQSVTAALLKLVFNRNNKTSINYKWIKKLDVMSHWHLQQHEWVLGALCCETEAEYTRKHILPHVRSAGRGRHVIAQDRGWREGQNGKQLRELWGWWKCLREEGWTAEAHSLSQHGLPQPSKSWATGVCSFPEQGSLSFTKS